MPTTRVLYVERDAALRGLLARLLSGHAGIEIVSAVPSAEAAISSDLTLVDVVLLDLHLDRLSLSGLDLALELRRRRPMGTVFFSSAPVPDPAAVVAARDYRGWSFIRKTSEVNVDHLVECLISTAKGCNVVEPGAIAVDAQGDALAQLSTRQRQIMALAALGYDGNAIATELGLAPVTIRQELSRSYAVLVPDAHPQTDLRTAAVLTFLRSTAGAAAPALG